MHHRAPVPRKQGHGWGVRSCERQPPHCGEIWQIRDSLFLLSGRQVAYGWNHVTAHAGAFRVCEKFKERESVWFLLRRLFGDVSIHQTATAPVLLFPSLSVFTASESRARLERSGGCHCASLMLDRLIGSAVEDGYTWAWRSAGGSSEFIKSPWCRPGGDESRSQKTGDMTLIK